MKLAELARMIGAVCDDGSADRDIEISAVRPITEATPGTLSFIANPSYEKYLDSTTASALIVSNDLVVGGDHAPALLRAPDPYIAFAKALAIFNPRTSIFTERIHPTAVIHPSATIADSARIGANVFVAHDVTIGEGTVVHPNCTIYDGVRIGARCAIGPGTVIGYDGFGYARNADGSYLKVPQLGGVSIEDDVEIGACCTIDRAAMADTILRRGVKLDNLVQIAHNVEIGEYTAIAAQTGISGSAKIGKRNQIAGQVGMVGHITTAEDVVVIAQSGVSKSIERSGTYFGAPAKEVRTAFREEAAKRLLPELIERVRVLEEKLRKLGQ
ncbi:MAG: UDP-3-O-(3-hydroxymyristoyl)glucosamine N-acyltransferase [Bacteroidetes bacterium]|nr:UDP-3-O-(3-hydroxymyristoyl)glucosamine N-acyltransferase [Bacteroidota bacterium]